MRYSVLLAALLMGCASLDDIAIREMASTSNAELCYIQVAGSPKVSQAAAEEGNQRSLTCTMELRNLGQQIAMNKDANARADAQRYAQALKNIGDGYARAANTPPPQPIRPLTCRTVPDGAGGSKTDCY